MRQVTTRRERLADAAITTLARAGMRGLTHRAVDLEAAVPQGSTSYYFRTRQALLEATVERLADLNSTELQSSPMLSRARDPVAIADALAAIVEQWLSTGRDRMLARYELALEANRRPELRDVLLASGARLRALAEAMLAESGASEPRRQAPLLVAYLDGLIFDHLAGAGALSLSSAELRAALRDLLRASIPMP